LPQIQVFLLGETSKLEKVQNGARNALFALIPTYTNPAPKKKTYIQKLVTD
jgi:hypothetical protein